MAARPSSTDQAVLRGEAIYLAGGTAVQLAWDQAGPPAPLVSCSLVLYGLIVWLHRRLFPWSLGLDR